VVYGSRSRRRSELLMNGRLLLLLDGKEVIPHHREPLRDVLEFSVDRGREGPFFLGLGGVHDLEYELRSGGAG
jgi:hypothetical protein